MIEHLTTNEAINGFYPTPEEITSKMLEGIEWGKITSVLEPSAGKGDIVKAVARKHRFYSTQDLEIDCIEIDTTLRSILKDSFKETKQADIRVIHDNFLTFKGFKKYDLIAMNPPFADGDKHLLKALDIQKNGGGIVCILNAETLKNTYSNTRKFLAHQLDKYEAKIEIVQNAFVSAERKTDVEIAIVKVFIPETYGESDIYNRMKKAVDEEETITEDGTALVFGDELHQEIQRYNYEVKATLEFVKQYKALEPFICKNIEGVDKYDNGPIIRLQVSTGYHDYKEFSSKKYMQAIRNKYWKAFCTNEKFIGRLTSQLRQKYIDMVDELKHYDFTLFNIRQVMFDMNSEMQKGIKETVLELFEKLTVTHRWYPECEGNIHYFNGWKTNEAHKIGKKSIIPTHGLFSQKWHGKGMDFNEQTAFHVILDIEKVFNFLSGEKPEKETMEQVLRTALREADKTETFRNIKFKYFTIDLFKKGTMHIKYTRPDLIDKLNIFAAQNKKWLPPSYGNAKYSDMTEEEKEATKNFHDGNIKEYEKVLSNTDFYITNISKTQQLLIESDY